MGIQWAYKIKKSLKAQRFYSLMVPQTCSIRKLAQIFYNISNKYFDASFMDILKQIKL